MRVHAIRQYNERVYCRRTVLVVHPETEREREAVLAAGHGVQVPEMCVRPFESVELVGGVVIQWGRVGHSGSHPDGILFDIQHSKH